MNGYVQDMKKEKEQAQHSEAVKDAYDINNDTISIED